MRRGRHRPRGDLARLTERATSRCCRSSCWRPGRLPPASRRTSLSLAGRCQGFGNRHRLLRDSNINGAFMQVAEASRLVHDCLYTGNNWLPVHCQSDLRDKNTMAETYRCPKCQSTQVKHWQFPDWMLVHWVLNPGLAFNELVLGQKVPKLTLVCQACQLPRAERMYIPCPGCNAIHDARIWDKKNAFGNWLGLICPTCATSPASEPDIAPRAAFVRSHLVSAVSLLFQGSPRSTAGNNLNTLHKPD